MQNIIKRDDFNFAFDTSKCQECDGNCCIGKSGYIWVNPKEIDTIAKFLNEDKESFLVKIGYKYSLREKQIGSSYECIFFDAKSKSCSIYPVRPNQCRTFPFWDYFKNNIKEVQKECSGIILL